MRVIIFWILEFGLRIETNKAPQRRRERKETILDINELSKRIFETVIEVLIVRRGATVVIPFCNLCVLCAFACPVKCVTYFTGAVRNKFEFVFSVI